MGKEYTEEQLKHQQEMKEKRDAYNTRKARTHRLIVRGAIIESLIENSENMTNEEFKNELYKRLGKYGGEK